MKIPANVVNFAAGNTDLYEAFVDYFNHYRYQETNDSKYEFSDNMKFAEKEEKMNAAIRKEIVRLSGVNMNEFPLETYINHPLVKYYTFAVVSALIETILPDVMIDSIGLFTEVRNIGFGDSASWNITPRDLFVVSKSGRAQKMTEVHKQFNGQVTLIPEMHQISTSVSLYRVLSGQEKLSTFVMKMARSMESQVTVDAFNAFNTLAASLDNAGDDALRFAGYSQSVLTKLCTTVSAWNNSRAVIVGTQAALNNILPADANYRFFLNDEYFRIGWVKEFMGYPTMVLPQVAAWKTPFTLALDDTKIYVMSPSVDKPIKLVMEGSTLSNTTGTFDASNLQQEATIYKSWTTGVATSSIMGVITL